MQRLPACRYSQRLPAFKNFTCDVYSVLLAFGSGTLQLKAGSLRSRHDALAADVSHPLARLETCEIDVGQHWCGQSDRGMGAVRPSRFRTRVIVAEPTALPIPDEYLFGGRKGYDGSEDYEGDEVHEGCEGEVNIDEVLQGYEAEVYIDEVSEVYEGYEGYGGEVYIDEVLQGYEAEIYEGYEGKLVSTNVQRTRKMPALDGTWLPRVWLPRVWLPRVWHSNSDS